MEHHIRNEFKPGLVNLAETLEITLSTPRTGISTFKKKRKTGMDIEGGYDNKGYIVLEEMIGTALIMIAVNCGQNIMPSLQPIAIGLIVTMSIIMFDKVTGAHFNPAVTIGCYITEGIRDSKNWALNFSIFIWYLIAEFVGATIGVIFVWLIKETLED